MIPVFLDKERIVHKPGVYIFRDNKEKVLYVGKAIDLYTRVSSYFSGAQFPKTASMVEKICNLDTIVVESEIEALILEANLIKKYLPLYNLKLTDDKDYLYIAITKEEFPKVITARKNDLKTTKKYFGPFPSSITVKKTLKKLRYIFPWCLSPKQNRLRCCFYYHLNLCPGPCIGKISSKDYNKIINRFSKFLEGKTDELLKELTVEMEYKSANLQFEEAQKIKKIVEGINYLLQPNRVAEYLSNPNFLQEESFVSLKQLQKDLNLPILPERIEAYDISNISGTDATGSMVVLTKGDIDKSQYRKFKIKLAGKPNDYAMHSEIMRRRLKHTEWGTAQLILIDGGRGQVRASRLEIKNLKLEIPIFGLAKNREWLYPPDGEIIKLPKHSLSLRLLQKIRDESHRFAITYHRKLREKRSGIIGNR